MQRNHVEKGSALGIVQTNHGAKAGILRMQPGDGLVFYSPKTAHPEGAPLREFTAIGRIAEGEIWQATDGDFHPWRRAVDYDTAAHATPIAPLLDVLEFTRGNSNWGFQLRRGNLELSQHDFDVIAREMGSATVGA